MTKKIPFPLLMSVLVLAEIVCSLESNMIFLALSSLYKIYGDPVRVGWLITIFTLTAAAAAAICSRLGDLYGRKRLLTIMLGIACLGSAISYFSQDLTLIILGRAFQGASMAVLPLCYGLLREHATEAQIPVGVGLLGGTYSFGVGLGAVTGGIIVDNWNWQLIFAVSAVLAFISILCVVAFIPASSGARRSTEKLDFVGGLMFVPAIAALLLALSEAKHWGWSSPLTLGTLAGGLIVLAIWVVYELRHKNPLIDLKLLSNRQIACSNLCMFLFGIGPLMTTFVFLPFMQQPLWTGTGLGVSAAVSGLLKIPANITSGLAVITAGYLATRLGTRFMVLLGAAVTTIGWMIMFFEHSTIIGVAGIMVILITPGTSMVFATLPGLIMEASPHDRTSEATGLTQVIRAIGMAIGSQLIAWLLATSLVANPDGSGQRLPSHQAYLLVFAVVSAISLTAALTVLAVPRRKLTDRPASSAP